MMLAVSLTANPVMQAMAEEHIQVDSIDTEKETKVFPGDVLEGNTPVYLDEDGETKEHTGGWTNDTAQAYLLVPMAGEAEQTDGEQEAASGYVLSPLGYVISVEGGTVLSADGNDQDNHADAQEGAEVKTDTAYYAENTNVVITAEPPKEGEVFDKWEVTGENPGVSDEQLTSESFTWTVTAQKLVLKATYKAEESETPAAEETAAPETDAPAVEETVAPETDAPAAEETVAPETDAPAAEETVAPETDAPVIGEGDETAPNITIVDEGAVDIMGAAGQDTTASDAQNNLADNEQQGETTAPETAAPETTVSETTAPETTAPETTAPETTAPETTTPETTAPETTAPETTAPETTAPETTAPAEYAISVIQNGVTVTVTSAGAAATQAAEGTLISLQASVPAGQTFTGWTVTRADNGAALDVANAQAVSGAAFTMPASGVTITANITETPTAKAEYTVTVENGSGDGKYSEGDYVDISADDPAPGYRFKNWTVVTGNAKLDNATFEETGFAMPAGAVTVKANYEQITYDLAVENGSGDGEYTMDSTVQLTADWPAEGKEFDKWTVVSGDPTINSADRYYASLVMPDADVTVRADYKDGPSAASNAITGIVDGNQYLKGATITFQAAGAGMENGNPNPGDYRYRPTSYQIGTVNKEFGQNYQVSMTINALGDYTLTVNYAKEVFDGSTWKADGAVDTKSAAIHIVNELAVKTGDSTPIIPIAIAGVAALVLIIVLVVLKSRKR